MKKLLTIILLISGCNNDVPTTLYSAPAPVTKDIDWCAKAEVNLKALKCIPVNEPYTKHGLTFTQFCAKKQSDGVDLNPKCLATQVTQQTGCSYMDVCTGSK